MASQSAVITGSTQGLGYAYARELRRRGWNVALCGRNRATVDGAMERLRAEVPGEPRIVGTACDTRRLADVEALWALAAREFGRVDLWINNAGFARTGVGFLETTDGELEAMVETNVIGTMHASNVAYAGLREQGGGRLFITLGGGASGRVVKGMTVYSTTKRALRYFADCLVKESRGGPVLVGTVSPGVNVTEGMLREIAALPPGERARVLKPLNFIGEHVETTAPWLVTRMLEAKRHGEDIVWLTSGRLMRRAFGLLGGRRDILSRYDLGT